VTSKYPIHPLSFDDISTYPIETRKSKVHAGLFGKAMDGSENILSFISKLPRILAGDHLRRLIRAILYAKSTRKPIIWGLGGHVVKVGLGPIFVDLMQHGFITGIVMNGAAAIHDFEVAFRGSTSEEVEEQIHSGRFGMARETGEFMNAAINEGVTEEIGMGESLGRYIRSHRTTFSYDALSILAGAYETSIPVTVHVAIGTDIIHIHPNASGPSLGAASFRDFQLFCSMVQELQGGGVYLNIGSAVVLPEVFLKAVSVVRNLGHPLEEFTTANLDFIQHYRPTQNVLQRPTRPSGQSVALTGHHEIMIPLIAAALKGASAGQVDA
jgi:hypothetical protein